MNIHHCIFKILGKKPASRTDTQTDTQTDGQMDNVKTVYPATNKVCRGYNKAKYSRAVHSLRL